MFEISDSFCFTEKIFHVASWSNGLGSHFTCDNNFAMLIIKKFARLIFKRKCASKSI